jgi:dynein heavy chain
MHTVLCFSPVGEAFRTRARKFPALVNCAMIDFFHFWPHDALKSVALRYLKEIEFDTDEIRDNIALDMADVHMSIKETNKLFLKIERRHNFTTPKSFLEFKDFYNKLLLE